ncbi:MAG TPA: helix-turn-helix transcriptional regulator [Blastocatellia bacterium]|nr:helix-turn-helix transcriptional regulator [Blastocatellia bacterium]
MAVETATLPEKKIRWTSRLIKRLRGKRSLAEFGALLGAPKNTVWRWEAGKSQPDGAYAERLSKLAERERFLKDWNLVGSMTLLDDLESAKTEIAEMFRQSLERSARQLVE